MKFNDAVFGLILMILGATVIAVVQGYPKIPGQQVGPALFPGLIATGLFIGGLALLVRGVRERAVVPWLALEDWVRSPRHLAGFAVLVASVLFYLFASEKLGFLPVAAIILTANFYVLKVPIGRAVLIAVIATLVIHFAFYKLLRVPLPWGVLTQFAW
ncbi:tripartite tricarboxylate transporter TctB family protein [soil metagenome]